MVLVTCLAAGGGADAEVRAVMADVSPPRLRATVDRLAAFGTRHTLSDTESGVRGVGAARRWVRDRMQEIAASSGRDDVVVELMGHVQPPVRRVPEEVEIVNVVMTIPGTMPEARGRRYVVLGHLDSRNTDPLDGEGDAPGANDDASGVACVLEAARVLAARPCDATLVFLATTGEEQGLLGATWFVRHAVEQGWDVRGALNNDMVGDPRGPEGRDLRGSVRVFSEGVPASATADDLAIIRRLGAENDSPSRQLARYVLETAVRHGAAVTPMLVFRGDRFLRGGDHRPFNEAGLAAVRFTDVHEKYDRQHVDVEMREGRPYGDVPEFVDERYLADVTRLNAAVLLGLARAPSPPPNARLLAAELTNDTTIRWDPSPEPDVAGYEIVVRATTAATWESSADVGPVLEHTLDLSKDDWLFGVRAYDQGGYRSPVAFPAAGAE